MLNWRCRWELLRCFYQGLPFAYPTESVFGIGCDPFNPEAVNRVIDLKGRSRQKGVIVCAASIDQIAPFLTDISADERRYMCQFWPGPTTFVVPLPKRHRWSW
ncbi:MAG: Sua5/YciO/YrdC/YwlC family protein, partial [Gammaproteobacteria bacterium]